MAENKLVPTELGTEKISTLLKRYAVPAIIAMTASSLYNMVDSIFIGQYDLNGLTAMSFAFPLQMLLIAVAVGTAVGVNFRGYAMYDFYDQIQTENESTGWEYVGILTANFELPVSKNVSLGAVEEVYGKAALYKKVPDVYQIVNTAKVYAKLKLK